ncbi:superinfection immunity protein [Shewanella xiamenensis]|uniref:superinfection immunity protein n=1 Tax=Shewanella xiamenensis TaxID=332186 RepID=UPI001C8FF6A0|nr:superinfection immunity protein [Shewanella xiamenensis]
MFLIRLLSLILLAGLSFGMGQIPSSQLNEFGQLLSASFILFAPLLYFYPMYEAYFHKQPNFYSIFALNLFLGWTLVGWVVALVWALKSHEPIKTINVASPEPAPASAPAPAPAPTINEAPKQIKQCPYCAEDILMAAKKCKHCGSEV